MGIHENFQGLTVFSLADQGDVTLDADMGRTGRLAGCRSPLRYRKSARDGLGISFVYGFSRSQSEVVFVRQVHRADFDAFPAPGAFAQVHVAGFSQDTRDEGALFSIKVQKLGIGQ
jgi:hypothetical protein